MRIELARFLGRLRLALPLLLVTLVAACGGEHIEVIRTTALPPAPPKAAFIVLQAAAQEGSENFKSYADRIATQLVQKGFTRVDKASQARYAVMLTFNEEELDAEAKAAEKRRQKRKDKDKDDHKAKEEDATERTLSIAIFDLTLPNSSGEKVFGAHAHCPPRKDGSGPVTPAMIDAVLRDFPGDEHESYSLKLSSAN